MAAPTTPLLSERRGGVRLLTLNRAPSRNALDPALVAALTGAVRAVGSEPGVRAVVLTGAGDAFCAGADLEVLRGLKGASVARNAADSARLKRLFQALLSCPRPVVAAVNGPALAGGCGLATACDLVLADPRATFGYPEVKVGFVAAMVSVLLSRQLGERAAREMLLTGRIYSADEARALGLVSRLAPAGGVVEEALAEAHRLASGAPEALALTKELLLRTSGLPLGQALDAAAAANVLAREGAAMQEGLDAFFARRRPAWVTDEHGPA